jgi:hypothetical protein
VLKGGPIGPPSWGIPAPHAIRVPHHATEVAGSEPCRDVTVFLRATRLLCFDEYTAALNRPQTRMDIGLEQLFVCMNSRAAASGRLRVPPGIPPASAGCGLLRSPFTPCPLIGQADLCARSPGTDRHGHLFANLALKRLGVWHGEGEQLDEAAVVQALDLKDRASRDDLAGFLVNTTLPRVVTARLRL